MKEIISKEFSLKDRRNFMRKLDDFLTQKIIRHFKHYTIERPVVIQKLQENIRLQLLNQVIIGICTSTITRNTNRYKSLL